MILNERTTLKELQDAGATTLSDIPLEELLEYVRHACLEVGADLSDSMSPWKVNLVLPMSMQRLLFNKLLRRFDRYEII